MCISPAHRKDGPEQTTAAVLADRAQRMFVGTEETNSSGAR